MLFSKDDSENLAKLVQNTTRIANAIEQVAEVVLKNDGKEFIPNIEQAIEEAKVTMYSTDMEQVADEEYIEERNRIIKSLKDREGLGNIPFFEEDLLSPTELEYMQE